MAEQSEDGVSGDEEVEGEAGCGSRGAGGSSGA